MDSDPYQQGIMQRTAASFQKLAALRGVSSSIIVNPDTGRYEANGVDCGVTVIRLQEWLNAQPGVKP
jgi:hypothetical protein